MEHPGSTWFKSVSWAHCKFSLCYLTKNPQMKHVFLVCSLCQKYVGCHASGLSRCQTVQWLVLLLLFVRLRIYRVNVTELLLVSCTQLCGLCVSQQAVHSGISVLSDLNICCASFSKEGSLYRLMHLPFSETRPAFLSRENKHSNSRI